MGIKANTPLLNLPPNDLGDTLPPGDLAQIELRVGRLEDILKGQEREWTPEKIQDPAGQTYIAYKAGATTRTMDRSFPISGSPAKWYWIDLETEIP